MHVIGVAELGLLLLSLLGSLAWALRLYSNWTFDFGSYYVAAQFASEQYQMFRDHIDHKGPVYSLFLKMIGLVIGYGSWQAYISLAVTAWIFLLSMLWIAKQHGRSIRERAFYLFLGLASLVFQTPNSSLPLLQLTTLFLFFQWGWKASRKTTLDWKTAFAMSFFFALSFLNRIDSVFYSPLFLVVALTRARTDAFGSRLLKLGLTSIIAITAIVAISVVSLHISSVRDMMEVNFIVNRDYRLMATGYAVTLERLFFRPLHLKLALQNGLILSLLLTLYSQRRSLNRQAFKRWKKRPEFFFLFSIAVLCIGLYIYTCSEKDYHLLILYPLFFFVIAFERSRWIHRLVLVALLSVPFAFDVYSRGLKSLHFSFKSPAEQELIEVLQDHPNYLSLFGAPWVYSLTGMRPRFGAVTHVYLNRIFADLQAARKLRNELKFLKPGDVVIVDAGNAKTSVIDEYSQVMANSEVIKTIGNAYEVRRLR
ncbi:MAG: hypothetical protein AB1540_10825 [Bdellovibrionota bacterium]